MPLKGNGGNPMEEGQNGDGTLKLAMKFFDYNFTAIWLIVLV